MIILAIDTSFDDTAAAVLKDTAVLSNVLSTELSVHLRFGGIVPNLARESHKQNLGPVITSAMKRAHVTWNEIDAIAVTQGPGLAIALEVGIAHAKELANTYAKPLIAVNHMEGHLLSFLANRTDAENKNLFPTLAVLISGGHTQFVLATEIGKYSIIGETKDDAMGECFDKVGRMLGLGYPAGKLVEHMAKKGHKGKVPFPVPMRQVKDANTSFSGLKTAAMHTVEKIKVEHEGSLSKQDIYDIALGFQTAAITHLTEKLAFALKTVDSKTLQCIVMGGGVVANSEVRKQVRKIAKQEKLPLYLPPSKKMCVDNAAMIGIAGYFKALRHEYGDPTNIDRKPVFKLQSM